MPKPIVAIARTKDGITEAVAKAASAACDLRSLVSGKQVVLKPNVFAPLPPPTTTDPRVVAALALLVRDYGAKEVIVAEGRSISTAHFRKAHRTTRECYRVTGMEQAIVPTGARLIALEEDEFVTLPIPDGRVLKETSVPRTIAEAEVLISVPVLKIHSLTLITVAIKNLHGIVSDGDKLFGHSYRVLPDKLVDIVRLKRPQLTVVDAVLGQQADHADDGRPVKVGAVLAGRDPVAVDAVASAVMGMDPLGVDTTRIAFETGVGEARLEQIEVVGTPIAEIRHQFALPDLELSESRFPGLRIYGGDYCRSCQYYTRRGVDRLVEQGLLDPSHPLSLVIGRDPVVPDQLEGRVIILGDCACESPSVKRLRDNLLLSNRLRFVYACPPMEFRIRAVDLLD